MPRRRFAFGQRAKTWGGVEDLYALLGLKPTDKTPNDLVKAAVTLILDLPALDETERSAFDETVQQIGETDANLAKSLASLYRELKRLYNVDAGFRSIGQMPTDIRVLLGVTHKGALSAEIIDYIKSHAALAQFLMQMAVAGPAGTGSFNSSVTVYLKSKITFNRSKTVEQEFMQLIWDRWLSRATGRDAYIPLHLRTTIALKKHWKELDQMIALAGGGSDSMGVSDVLSTASEVLRSSVEKRMSSYKVVPNALNMTLAFFLVILRDEQKAIEEVLLSRGESIPTN